MSLQIPSISRHAVTGRLLAALALTCVNLPIAAGQAAPVTADATADTTASAAAKAPAKKARAATEEHAGDGWPDISDFIDSSYGFIPLAIPITEPALGYGLGGGVAFVDKAKAPAADGFGRPNITFVGGMATENGTKGAAIGDIRHWHDDSVKTTAFAGSASVNLDYYGTGDAPLPGPLRYNLSPIFGSAQIKARVGESASWLGIGYLYSATDVSFEAPGNTPGIPGPTGESRIGGLSPTYSYDTRDNIFTPTRGTLVECTVDAFSEALGSDEEFQRLTLTGIQYLALSSTVTLGLRGDFSSSYGNTPFYLRPSINMRGIAAMRYQGEEMAQGQAEIRWQCWRRFSLVTFVGTGVTSTDILQFEKTQSITSGGVGFRYELADRHGLHVGVDVAYSKDQTAFYIQFGSAWARP